MSALRALRWNCDAKPPSRAQIQHELEIHGHLDGEVPRLRALQNPVHIRWRPPIQRFKAGAVAHESAGFDVLHCRISGGYTQFCGELREERSAIRVGRGGRHVYRVGSPGAQFGELLIQLLPAVRRNAKTLAKPLHERGFPAAAAATTCIVHTFHKTLATAVLPDPS